MLVGSVVDEIDDWIIIIPKYASSFKTSRRWRQFCVQNACLFCVDDVVCDD